MLRGNSGPCPWEEKHSVTKTAKSAASLYLALTPDPLIFSPRRAPQPGKTSASAQVSATSKKKLWDHLNRNPVLLGGGHRGSLWRPDSPVNLAAMELL